MNKRTRAIDEETYKIIISTMQNGFEYKEIQHKLNERIATVLQLEYNLGLRVGDILNLTMDSFMRDGSRYQLDMHERQASIVISQCQLRFIILFVIMLMIMALVRRQDCFP